MAAAGSLWVFGEVGRTDLAEKRRVEAGKGVCKALLTPQSTGKRKEARRRSVPAGEGSGQGAPGSVQPSPVEKMHFVFKLLFP